MAQAAAIKRADESFVYGRRMSQIDEVIPANSAAPAATNETRTAAEPLPADASAPAPGSVSGVGVGGTGSMMNTGVGAGPGVTATAVCVGDPSGVGVGVVVGLGEPVGEGLWPETSRAGRDRAARGQAISAAANKTKTRLYKLTVPTPSRLRLASASMLIDRLRPSSRLADANLCILRSSHLTAPLSAPSSCSST